MSVEFPRDWSDREVCSRLVSYTRRGRAQDAERMALELVDRMATVATENRRLRDASACHPDTEPTP